MRRLCIDEDTSDKVCTAMRKLRPLWNIVFVRQWAGDVIKDPVLLGLLWEDRRTLISRDRATLPDWTNMPSASPWRSVAFPDNTD